MAKSRRHPHKYHRVDLEYAKVFSCALPECSHYMPKHMEKTLPGKQSVCWGCDEVFILDEDALKSDRPMCIKCRTGINTTPDAPEAPVSEDSMLQKFLKQLET